MGTRNLSDCFLVCYRDYEPIRLVSAGLHVGSGFRPI